MRIAIDREQLTETLTEISSSLDVEKAAQIMVKSPHAMELITAISRTAQVGEPPKNMQEAMQKLITTCGTAFSIGFQVGRAYQDKEGRGRVEIIQ